MMAARGLSRRTIFSAIMLAAGLAPPSRALAVNTESANMFQSQNDIVVSLLTADPPLAAGEAKLLAAQARPGVWLETIQAANEADIPLGASKIGGKPDLPAHFEWPLRPLYLDAGQRAKRYQDDYERVKKSPPDWLAADQVPGVLEDYLKRIKAVSGAFPLSFICQVNLAEISKAGPIDPDLPQTGRFWLFYDTIEGPWGFDPAESVGARLIYEPDPSVPLTRRDHPAVLEDFRDGSVFQAASCAPHPCLMPLPPQSAVYDALAISQDTRNAYWAWGTDNSRMYSTEHGKDWKCHHVSGWPTPVQGDMQTECAIVEAGYSAGTSDSWKAARAASADKGAVDWVLLLQIGSDGKAGMMWGDAGQLYVWIHREDLRARRFEKARLKLQGY